MLKVGRWIEFIGNIVAIIALFNGMPWYGAILIILILVAKYNRLKCSKQNNK